MQIAQQIPRRFPWRTATLAVGVVAALELVALIALVGIRVAPDHHRTPAGAATTAPKRHAAPAARHLASLPSHPLRPRRRVRVLVLNGNGIAGAAAAEAQRLRLAGYRIGGAANAPGGDYVRSTVMYAPGWAKEAHRLARETGVRGVGPIDGLRRSQLRGSKLVILLGR